MTSSGEHDPILDLLNELVAGQRELKQQHAQILDKISSLDTQMKRSENDQRVFIEHTKKDFTEVKGELQRQDGQITALDARIGGNYRGQAAQIELVLGEMRNHGERLSNMERAIVETSRSTQTLHGRLIEEASDRREESQTLKHIVDDLVRRVDEMLPPSIEQVVAASGSSE